MNVGVTRRAAMLGVASLSTLGSHGSTAIARLALPAAADQIRAIEAKNGGRLGVLIVDTTGSAERIAGASTDGSAGNVSAKNADCVGLGLALICTSPS
jgi:hypothetical protein